MTLKIADIKTTEKVFTHISKDGVVQTTVAVDRLAKHVRRTSLKPVCVPVEQPNAAFIERECGIESHRLLRLPVIGKWRPILMIQWEDGLVTVADGNHRYLRAFQLGRSLILAWIILPDVWRGFVIEDYPHVPVDVLKAMPSGIS